jgi:hypothetical protein
MSKTAIISINALGHVLTASQKEFNRLCAKIKDLRRQVEDTEEESKQLLIRMQTDLRPLAAEFNAQRAQFVRLLDRHLDEPLFKEGERKKMRHLIEEICTEIMASDEYEDLKKIYEKHIGQSFEEMEAENQAEVQDAMKRMAEGLFGIEFDDDADVSTPEKMQAYMAQKMADEEEKAAARKAEQEARRQAKPKTEKQKQAEEKRAAKELKKQEEASKITKSVREVYLDLVKAFHPDREKDEDEKARKTAIMQRVTVAYEANDLLELLNLQMELERIDQQHLENLAEDRLKLFNKVLRDQVRELQDQLTAIEMELATYFRGGMMAYRFSIHKARFMLNEDIKAMRTGISDIKKDLQNLDTPKTMKAWLKYYKIPSHQDMMDDFFEGMFGR